MSSNHTIFLESPESIERPEQPDKFFYGRRDLKREEEGRFYNFTIQFDTKSQHFHLFAKVPTNYSFSEQLPYHPFPFFFTLYKTELVRFEEFPEQFLVKEGTRCNYNCSKLTKECMTLDCWDRPFACFGNFEECMKLEGDGTCIKTAKENSSLVEELKDDDYEVLSSNFFWHFLRLSMNVIVIDKEGWGDNDVGRTFFWKCQLQDEINVFCNTSGVVSGVARLLLKGVAG